ncbi:hypothetical protein YDYSY3_29040 [Paenibacillus chitinolyticus]|nr:hypothetical protein YDYSY3_29040 [Paenibacillus chitinolyticus]
MVYNRVSEKFVRIGVIGMKRNRLFKIVVYIMLFSMVASTLMVSLSFLTTS